MHTLFCIKNDPVETVISGLANNTLKTVKCGQLKLDSESSKKIFSALKDCTSVQKLEFVGNYSHEAIDILANSIKVHRSLAEIYLGDNGLDDNDLIYLCNSLKENQSAVELLDINYNQKITDVGAHAIAELIKNSTRIKKIEIYYTNITDTGLRIILSALKENPKSPLLEICDPYVLQAGHLTQNKELTQEFIDVFSAKENHIFVNEI